MSTSSPLRTLGPTVWRGDALSANRFHANNRSRASPPVGASRRRTTVYEELPPDSPGTLKTLLMRVYKARIAWFFFDVLLATLPAHGIDLCEQRYWLRSSRPNVTPDRQVDAALFEADGWRFGVWEHEPAPSPPNGIASQVQSESRPLEVAYSGSRADRSGFPRPNSRPVDREGTPVLRARGNRRTGSKASTTGWSPCSLCAPQTAENSDRVILG